MRLNHLEFEACVFDFDGETDKQAVYVQLFDEVPRVPGALEFLAIARANFQKLSLATSAARHDFELGAHKYQLAKWFDAIVTGDDTARHNPDSEFRQASLLGGVE